MRWVYLRVGTTLHPSPGQLHLIRRRPVSTHLGEALCVLAQDKNLTPSEHEVWVKFPSTDLVAFKAESWARTSFLAPSQIVSVCVMNTKLY